MTLQQLLLVKPSSQLLKNVSEDNSDLATLDVAEVKLNMIFALTSNYYTVRTLAVSHMRWLNKNCAIRKTLIQCFKNKQTTSAAFPDTIIAPHSQCNALEQTAFKYTNESMQFGADL